MEAHRTRLATARIVKPDAELIAEAVAQGKVRRVLQGATGLSSPPAAKRP